MEVKSPDLQPSPSCCSSNRQQGSVTKLPQPCFSGEQKKSHLPEFFVDLQGTQWSGQISPEIFHPCWDNTKRSFHHHCNNQREDELNKTWIENTFWVNSRFSPLGGGSDGNTNLWPEWMSYPKFCFFLSFQGGIPRNFHNHTCPKKVPQNCLISVKKAHEFVE